eukprot:CAMPEP_0177654112 /NCGR_PEP_ID=MMETSP0447-20121125/14128_1 /TAXON_ID=0 /ORGANISM="Stygamoeba regulata, Strain BSH-02190019" /LENGTH=482 /DNA_ID=CAMNT_0019157679 /DNA_START=68 /DNA_END=1512 /DNA_ORIENTATION=+
MLLPTLIIVATLASLLWLCVFSWRAKVQRGIPFARGCNQFFFGHTVKLIQLVKSGRIFDFFLEETAYQKYNMYQISCLGSQILVTCNPEHIEYMFGPGFEDFAKGDIAKDTWKPLLGYGIFTADGEDWKEMRKVSSYLFSTSSLKNHMTSVFLKHSSMVLDHLRAVPSGQSIDIQALLQRYTFDSICTIAFGLPVDSLNGNKDDVQFQEAYDAAQSIVTGRFFKGSFWKLESMLGIGEERELPKHIAVVDNYLYKIVDDRLAQIRLTDGEDQRGDMLSLYIAFGKKKGKQFDRKFLRDMVTHFIIAGRDTTSAATMWLLYELSKNPQHESRLMQEIQTFSEEGISYEAIGKMDYLRAMFYETLRLHPSVPVEARFSLHDTYLEPGHIFVHKDTFVNFPIIAMGQNPALWGEDAAEFRPERWLEGGKFRDRAEKEYPVFNVKPRSCLGKRMAELESAVMLCSLLKEVRLRVKSGFQPRYMMGA